MVGSIAKALTTPKVRTDGVPGIMGSRVYGPNVVRNARIDAPNASFLDLTGNIATGWITRDIPGG